MGDAGQFSVKISSNGLKEYDDTAVEYPSPDSDPNLNPGTNACCLDEASA